MPAKDVIVVLAGGIRANGALPEGVKLRVQVAVQLFHQQQASKMIMSGKWSLFRQTIPPFTEAEAMARYAWSLGVPEAAILKEEQSNNTTSNAFYTLEKFLKPNHWKKVIVVTSDYHLLRAKFIFDNFLGPDYQLQYVAAPAVGSLSLKFKRWINEKVQLFVAKKYLQDFFTTNDKKLAQKFKKLSELEAHPLYLFLSAVFPRNAMVFLKLFQRL